MNKVLYLIVFVFSFGMLGFAQPAYDNCNAPFTIPDVTNYCSNVGEFTNLNATPSGYGPATCWTGTGRDVWFRFRAFFTDIDITIIGKRNPSPGGTLARPQMALYSGVCGGTISELKCASDAGNLGELNIHQGGLIVGADYFIRIDGINNSMGSFQLCLNNYNPPALAGQDCSTAGILCDKSPFVVQKVTGTGTLPDEAFNSCLRGNQGNTSESSSVWYSWVAANDGTLTFTMRPLNSYDDIDFVVYELPSGIHNCTDKMVLRCNATHPRTYPASIVCGILTGLDSSSVDLEEDVDCNFGEDGFCKYIDMQKGKAYALLVNNYNNSGIGFSIDWGGTGEFASPIANFGIEPPSGLKCETDFMVIDSSISTPGINIIRWDWNFGKDAIPQTGTGNSLHTVRYNSFGEKFVTLTIQTSFSDVLGNNIGGCQLTEIRRVFVEPCCEDLPTLRIRIDSMRNLTCYKSNDGMIAVNGNQGSPYDEVINGTTNFYYQYSLDKQEFSQSNLFTNLSAGKHTVHIQDRKGCLDSIEIVITEPEEVIPNAGSDIEIELGDYIDLNATATPSNFYNFKWYRGDSIDCKNCQNTKALPFNDGYYSVNVTNENGCLGLDSFFVRVRKNYFVYPPNVFSPNGDNINDIFHILGSKSFSNIDLMQIFDRWGNLLYQGENLSPNNAAAGWNGRANGEPCNPGVYVYVVKARFLDGHTESISGDLTLIR